MREYVKLNEHKPLKVASVDEMSVNGEAISGQVPGYRQLSVSGRGIMSEHPNTTEVPARAGVWLNYNHTEPRVLTVQYRLQADSSEELRERFNQLNKLLRAGERLDVTFADEPGWHYYAVLSGANQFKEDRLSIVSEFELFCPDPYAYGPIQSGSNVRLTYAHEVLPHKIDLTAQGSDNIELSNGRDRLVLNGSYSSGQTVRIDYQPEQVIVSRDGLNVNSDLARFSYPEAFYLRDGDNITVKNARLATLEWRDHKL